MFTQDFVINGKGTGPVAERIFPTGKERFDPGMWRPFYDEKTRQKCVRIFNGRSEYDPKTREYIPQKETVLLKDLRDAGVDLPITNATTLEYRQWAMLDNLVIPAARLKLRAWADLAAANPYTIDGFGKTILEHQTTNDPGEAFQDMDGLSEGRNSRRTFQLEGTPLYLTHQTFTYNKRELAIGQNAGTPINVRDAEAALFRVMEKVEQSLIGSAASFVYGDSTNYSRTAKGYGYTTYPDRATVTLTTPTGSNPQSTVSNVLSMRDALYNNGFEDGPYMLYTGKSWDTYLDNDYAFTNGSNYAVNPSRTLRDRILAIEGIAGIRRLPYLSGYQMILVQMTPQVAQAINGMNITTVQWETVGGMQVHFKWMCIYVPRIMSDINGNCGICHGNV